jgi:transcriptional regulator with XRE-family HTH domain
MKQTTQQRLREALSARNMLPIELSRLSGIGKSAISQYLSGKVTPKQDKIYKLAQALKVSESWLMGYDEPMEQSPAPASDDLPDLTPKDEREITRMMDDMKDKLMQEEGLMFDGHPASPESIQSILDAMQIGMEMAKRRNKAKYTPKKYRPEG